MVESKNINIFAACLRDKHNKTFSNLSPIAARLSDEKMKKSNSNVLEFTTKFINSNFRIKVFGHTEDGKKINTLVGVSGILKLIGAELFNKFIKRALKAGLDACRCALRRGLVVTLYAK